MASSSQLAPLRRTRSASDHDGQPFRSRRPPTQCKLLPGAPALPRPHLEMRVPAYVRDDLPVPTTSTTRADGVVRWADCLNHDTETSENVEVYGVTVDSASTSPPSWWPTTRPAARSMAAVPGAPITAQPLPGAPTLVPPSNSWRRPGSSGGTRPSSTTPASSGQLGAIAELRKRLGVCERFHIGDRTTDDDVAHGEFGDLAAASAGDVGDRRNHHNMARRHLAADLAANAIHNWSSRSWPAAIFTNNTMRVSPHG